MTSNAAKNLQSRFERRRKLDPENINALFRYIGKLEAAAGQSKEAMRKNLVHASRKDEGVLLEAYEQLEALGI